MSKAQWKRVRQRWRREANQALVAAAVLNGLAGKLRGSTEQLRNLAQTCGIFYADFYLSARDFMGAADRQRHYYARVFAVICCTCFEHFGGLLDRRLRAQIASHLRDRFDKLVKELENFRAAHGKLLTDVRNWTIAHRHKDASVQIETTLRPNFLELENLAIDLGKWLDDLGDFVADAIEAAPLEESAG